jgi:preprotein translocase subunit YajC
MEFLGFPAVKAGCNSALSRYSPAATPRPLEETRRMLISAAYAQTATDATTAGGFGLVQLLPLVLIFVVFYFLLIRPQQKKMKQHRDMVSALRRGDRVVTSGGIIGLVTKVLGDNELQIEIADGVRVRTLRSSVTEVVSKTEPVAANAADDEEETPEKK